jgi:hypothetical protein
MAEPPIFYATYDDPMPSTFGAVCAWGFFGAFAVVLAYEPLMWVDQHTFPILGYIVYPFEWVASKIAFPDAVTPLRGNIGALLVGALLAFLAALAAGAVAVVVGLACWLWMGALIFTSWLTAAVKFARNFHSPRSRPPGNRVAR